MKLTERKEAFLQKLKDMEIRKREYDYNVNLIENINMVKKQIESCKQRFNLLSDDNLVESLIYEERALYARYAYLIELAKSKSICSEKIYS